MLRYFFCQNGGNKTDPIIVNGVHRALSVSMDEWIQFLFSLFLERIRATETADGSVDLKSLNLMMLMIKELIDI